MPLFVLCLIQYGSMQPLILPGNVLNETDLHAEREWESGGGGVTCGGQGGGMSENNCEKLTSEPAAAQLIRLLLGLAIQKVEVALQRESDRKKKQKTACLLNFKQVVELVWRKNVLRV